MDVNNRLRMRIELYVYVFLLAFTSTFVTADKAAVLFFPFPFEKCPENEMFKACLEDCTNCEQRGRCPVLSCEQKGCDCQAHFVRLTPGGKCEPVSKCPIPTCGENEVYRACGPTFDSCGAMRQRVLSCDYKCYCKEGFFRDHQGKCIPRDECPPRTRCPPGEQLAESGLSDEYYLHSETEVVSNATVNKTGCYCKEGYKRNLMGHCMMEEFCPFIKCRTHEKYQSCPSKCNTTCSNYGDPSCKEDGNCYPGCFCEDGYVMNDHSRCVPKDECPPKTTAASSIPEMVTESPSDDEADSGTTNGTPPGTKYTTQMDESVPTADEDDPPVGTVEKDEAVTVASSDGAVTDGTSELSSTTPKLKPTKKPGKTRNVRSADPTPTESVPKLTPAALPA